MTVNYKLATLCVLANLPVLLAIALISREPSQKEIFDRVSKYALAYESAVDKEEYLTRIYDDVKSIDENSLPPDLLAFVIKVKVSQFGKLD
jgi:hypothetical protein